MDRVVDVSQVEALRKMRKIIPIFIFIIILLVLVFGSVGTIGAGERGVLLRFGAVQDRVIGEGLFFKIPVIDRVQKMDVKIQKDEVPASASSKDLQIVTSRVAINYNLLPDSVNKVWQEVGTDYNQRIIAPAIQEAVKAVTARFTAEELIIKREIVKEEIKENLLNRLSIHHIAVVELNITSFDFSPAFNEAIEAKVTAEQLKLKAERDLERIKIEAEQRVIEAEARAKSIQIEAEALSFNPKVVELRWIEKWNGEAPMYWGNASPFIGLPSVE